MLKTPAAAGDRPRLRLGNVYPASASLRPTGVVSQSPFAPAAALVASRPPLRDAGAPAADRRAQDHSRKSTKIKSGLAMGLMKPPRIPRRPPPPSQPPTPAKSPKNTQSANPSMPPESEEHEERLADELAATAVEQRLPARAPGRCTIGEPAMPTPSPAARGSAPPAAFTAGSPLINDNYFCRSPWWRWAGRGSTRGACDTARFPHGGRVGHGCAGSAIA